MASIFSDGFRSALVRAAEEVRRLGAREVGDAHLLLGLTWEPDLTLDALWDGLGIDNGVVYWRTMASLEVHAEPMSARAEFAFSPDAQEALRLAMAEAERSGDLVVGTEHLLRGLLVQGGAASAVLRECGLTPENAVWRREPMPHRVLRELDEAMRTLMADLKRNDVQG